MTSLGNGCLVEQTTFISFWRVSSFLKEGYVNSVARQKGVSDVGLAWVFMPGAMVVLSLFTETFPFIGLKAGMALITKPHP